MCNTIIITSMHAFSAPPTKFVHDGAKWLFVDNHD